LVVKDALATGNKKQTGLSTAYRLGIDPRKQGNFIAEDKTGMMSRN